MSRRRKNPPRPAPAAETPGAASNAPSTAPRGEAGVRRLIAIVIIAVFVIFEIAIFAIFRTGEQIHWKKELSSVDALHAGEKHAEAAKALAAFGEKWTGAMATFDWNRKMGLYHGLAGDWKTAARHYAEAVRINPKAPGINAAAGEAFLNDGQEQKAVEFLRAEVDKIPRATGDHDRAHFHLGVVFHRAGDDPAAFREFEAISDRPAWSSRIGELRAELASQVIDHAREEARAAVSAELPPS